MEEYCLQSVLIRSSAKQKKHSLGVKEYIYYNKMKYLKHHTFTIIHPIQENHLNILYGLDARSIKAIDNLIIDYGIRGSGIWNLMIYYQQMWTIIISRFNIVKLLPEKFNNIG